MRSGLRPVTSSPPSRTVPEVGARSPESRLVSVDLPAPLGPITAWMRSRQRSSVTSFTAASPPKRLVRPRADSRTSLIAVLPAQHAFQQAEQSPWSEGDDRDNEQAGPQLPVLAGVETADGGQVLRFVQQHLEGEGAGDGAGEVAHAAEDDHHDGVRAHVKSHQFRIHE